MWREKCCESTFTQISHFSLLSQLQTQQSFSQISLNSSIIRFSEYKLKNTMENKKRSSYVSGHSQFAAEESNKKKQSSTSRGSNEEGMLSFTTGVILSNTCVVKSSGGVGMVDFDHLDLEALVVKEVDSSRVVDPEK